MKSDGFTTMDAVAAIVLTGLSITGMGPLFRAYSSDLPEILVRNREGIVFHHLSLDVQQCMDDLQIPYWSAGPDLQLSKNRLDITAAEGSLILTRDDHGIRLLGDEGSRFYRFRSPPAWEPIRDPAERYVGVRLIHEGGLCIDLHFRMRALGALQDDGG